MRKISIPVCVNPVIVDDVEIVSFTGIVSKANIGHILCPVVLDESAER